MSEPSEKGFGLIEALVDAARETGRTQSVYQYQAAAKVAVEAEDHTLAYVAKLEAVAEAAREHSRRLEECRCSVCLTVEELDGGG